MTSPLRHIGTNDFHSSACWCYSRDIPLKHLVKQMVLAFLACFASTHAFTSDFSAVFHHIGLLCVFEVLLCAKQ